MLKYLELGGGLQGWGCGGGLCSVKLSTLM